MFLEKQGKVIWMPAFLNPHGRPWLEFLAPGFSLAQPWLLWQFKERNGRHEISPCFSFSLCVSVSALLFLCISVFPYLSYCLPNKLGNLKNILYIPYRIGCVINHNTQYWILRWEILDACYRQLLSAYSENVWEDTVVNWSLLPSTFFFPLWCTSDFPFTLNSHSSFTVRFHYVESTAYKKRTWSSLIHDFSL